MNLETLFSFETAAFMEATTPRGKILALRFLVAVVAGAGFFFALVFFALAIKKLLVLKVDIWL